VRASTCIGSVVFVACAVLGCGDGSPTASADAGAPGILPGPFDVTLRALLDELSSFEHLATWRPGRSVLFSSTDPAASDPEDATLDGWFANGDRGHFHGTSSGGREDVMAEVDGPGVLTRVWSANPHGTIRVYVDETLAIEGPMDELLAGRDARFPPPFAYEAAGGVTFASPIPFARHLRVTCEGTEGLYYHVGVRRYPEGTVVEPWSEAAHDALATRRREIAAQLEEPGGDEVGREESFVLDGTPFELEGAGLVRVLRLRPRRFDEATLRAAVLSIAFDGVETVRVPLGDFFGHGPGVASFDTALASMREDGTLISRLPMPFATQLTIAVESPEPLVVEGTLRVDAPIDTTWRLVARWRDLGTERTQPRRDWRVAALRGEGALVGLLLQVGNGGRAWWGEGDEKIYIDGEAFPSWFGTGTEDYFGAAFCSLDRYARPFHAQTRAPDARGHVGEACSSGPGHVGRTSNLRWHVLDPIRFSSELVFDLELWHWWFADWSLRALVYAYADPSLEHDFVELAPGSEVEPFTSLRGDGMLPGETPEPR
jgi:hypothetical protein